MDLIFLIVWSFLGLIYIAKVWSHETVIPNKDKYRLVVLFAGPCVWGIEIIKFIFSAVAPLFSVIDEWVKKE